MPLSPAWTKAPKRQGPHLSSYWSSSAWGMFYWCACSVNTAVRRGTWGGKVTWGMLSWNGLVFCHEFLIVGIKLHVNFPGCILLPFWNICIFFSNTTHKYFSLPPKNYFRFCNTNHAIPVFTCLSPEVTIVRRLVCILPGPILSLNIFSCTTYRDARNILTGTHYSYCSVSIFALRVSFGAVSLGRNL